MPEKFCVLCHQDCSTRPRVKNPRGEYVCKACLETKKHQSQGGHAPRSDDPLGLEPMPDDLFDGVAPATGATGGPACPGCGSPLGADAIICTNCGMNLQTGTSATTRTIAAKEPSAIGGAAAATGGALAAPIVWTIGGAVGGAIGAAIWAGVSHFLQLEASYVALLVGGLTGVGVSIAARGGANAASGGVAVIIAVVAVLAGKFAAASLDTEGFIPNEEDIVYDAADYAVTEDELLYRLADQIAFDREQAGESLRWPDGMSYDEADELNKFPRDIQRAVRARWDALSDDQKQQRLAIGSINDDEFVAEIARTLAREKEASNQSVAWPPGESADTAYFKADFPPEIWDDAHARWDALADADKSQQREEIRIQSVRKFRESLGDVRAALTEYAFENSFTAFDILWFGLAVVVAFGAGSKDLSELGSD